jgi:RNA polymerase sigma factor (sigma-70 family)
MTSSDKEQRSASPNAGRFATTRWSMVAEAGRHSSPEAAAALADLCKIYWYPLYAYVRRQGQSKNDAQDLTQEFFVEILDKGTLQVADRERGRFRSFLLASLKNFLTNEWRKGNTQKRGGGRPVISLDFDDGENRYQLEPSHDATPEKIYERQWALTLLERALTKLRAEFENTGKTELFQCLKTFVGGDKSAVPYRELGEQLNMSEGAVKVAIHRMRKRYRAILRDEIQQTVVAAEDVDEELRELFNTLAS